MSESYYFVPAEFASSPTRIRMCRFVLEELQKGAKPGTKGYSGRLDLYFSCLVSHKAVIGNHT